MRATSASDVGRLVLDEGHRVDDEDAEAPRAWSEPEPESQRDEEGVGEDAADDETKLVGHQRSSIPRGPARPRDAARRCPSAQYSFSSLTVFEVSARISPSTETVSLTSLPPSS